MPPEVLEPEAAAEEAEDDEEAESFKQEEDETKEPTLYDRFGKAIGRSN